MHGVSDRAHDLFNNLITTTSESYLKMDLGVTEACIPDHRVHGFCKPF